MNRPLSSQSLSTRLLSPGFLSTLSLGVTLSLGAATWSVAKTPAADAPAADAPAADAPAADAPAADAPATPRPPRRAAHPASAPADPAAMPAEPGAAPADAAAPADPSAAPATAPADTEPAATQPVEINVNQGLADDVKDYWYYGKVARYDLASAYGTKILGRTEAPVEILTAFEKFAVFNGDVLDQWLLRWQSLDAARGTPAAQMRETTVNLVKLLNKGRYERRNDIKFIEEQITRLGGNFRVFNSAVEQLRQGGEVAAAAMVMDLARPERAALHGPIGEALVRIGRPALAPMLAATAMRNNDSALIMVVSCLGRMRLDMAVPYLVRLKDDTSASPSVRSATQNALNALNPNLNGKSLADLFYALGERFYYGNAMTIDMKAPTAYLWKWDGQTLASTQVPPSIFNDLMSMRESRTALEIGSGREDALSLWLAANNKREVDLGEGNTDPTNPKLTAAFYNVAAGPQYLAAVLTRSLQDHNADVAMKVTKSLAQITGPSSLVSGGNPLVEAMQYPDRLVRFEAAFALANALPTQTFSGSEAVAPLLAEAVSQTGTANIVVVVPSEAQRIKLMADLKGYGVVGGSNAQSAVANASALPAVDVLLVNEDLGSGEIEHLFQLADQSPRLARAARLVITHSKASRWAQLAIANPLLSTTQSTDPTSLAKDVEDARKRVGGLPLNEQVATQYALRGAQLLEKIAINRNAVYDLTNVEPTLMASLNDKRPEVAKAVGVVLATLDSKTAQPALLDRALDDKTPEEVRISFFQSVARSAKSFGNRLESTGVEGLQKVVAGAGSPELRTAAAEARGALSLPADEARQLIIDQKS